MRTEVQIPAPASAVRLPDGVAGPRSPLATLVDLCRARAAAEPARRGFVFLADGVDESDSLTLAELDRRARAVAVTLRELAAPGARVLLSYPPGLDFHAAFWGCLYAGLVAVPVAPLDGNRQTVTWTRVDSVAASAEPSLFLSTRAMLAAADPVLAETPGLAGLTCVATDELDAGVADRWSPPEITADTVAYLQYSSGSTGLPKGVTLTHGNVLHNLALIYESTRRASDEVGLPRPPVVGWLPVHYNMGLVGSLLDPLFSGRDATLLPAAVFVQRPYSWLRTISDLGRADSAAPNFAYDHCVRRVTDEQRRRLDLSRWEVALLGGEPVRAATLDRFSRAFAGCGFRREALFPGYGLAESTVMVTGGPAGRRPMILQLDPAELAAGRARPAEPGDGGRELVGCGQVHPSVTVVVADPATGETRADNEVGEVLVSGPSIGTGYWNAPQLTAETFAAGVPGQPGRFLRTGDLGFLHGGQLFITGRAKDVIIIAGANHYPQDIEATVAASHPAIRDLGCCAVPVDHDDRERLVVLAEVSPDTAPDSAAGVRELTDAIRQAVRREHGLQVHDVVLLPPGSLPVTTNLKLQRRECRTRYMSGAFDAVALTV